MQGKTGEVDRALAEAYAGLQGRNDVNVPALYSRLADKPLFGPPNTPDSDVTLLANLRNWVEKCWVKDLLEKSSFGRALIALVIPPNPDTTWLANLCKRVEQRIKDVLEDSSFERALIELGMEPRPDALDQPWKQVRLADDSRRELPPQTRVLDVYRKCDNTLLILGAPGSGKTTMLRQLAHPLSRPRR